MAIIYYNDQDVKGTLTTSGAATFGGNVTVVDILHIDSAGTGNPYIDWRQSGSQKAYIQYADTGDVFDLSSDGQMRFKTGGENVALTIDTSQNATFASILTVSGKLNLQTLANATFDTDKFLVSDSGTVKYRTGAEVLSDIGGAPATGGAYLPLAGGTLTGDFEAPGVYVGATNTNFDFYNQGTSYFNGTVTVDAAFTQSGGDASTFSGDVKISGDDIGLIIENTTETKAGISFIDAQAPTTQAAAIKFDSSAETLDFFVNDASAERMSITTSGRLIITSGDLFLQGTGRIQGVDTVTDSTDAANKAYVDAHPAGTVIGTGVATRVAFWSGTSSLSADSDLYWDDTNNRLGIATTSPTEKLEITGNAFVNGQVYTKGSSIACFTVGGDLDTGFGNFDGSGQVGLVSNNKAVITAKDDNIAFDAYVSSSVATTGSLNANQSQQALTSDTLANLTVDPTGNIVRGSQEGTWTFTKAQIDALTTSTTSGTTLIAAPGANKAIIVEESNLMIRYSGTGTMSSNSFVIRQAHNGDATAEITRLPSGQINTIMSSAPANPSYGFYSRDLPLYNNDGRSFVTNKATFLTRISTNATPTNLVSISIKLKYRIFNASTF